MIIFTGITSGQYQIPAGAIDWTISAISGGVIVNGAVLPNSNSVRGSAHDIRNRLTAAINVGCTGGYAFVAWNS